MWALQRLRKLIANEFGGQLNVEAILGVEVSEEGAAAYNVSLLVILQNSQYNLMKTMFIW